MLILIILNVNIKNKSSISVYKYNIKISLLLNIIDVYVGAYYGKLHSYLWYGKFCSEY